MKFYDETKPLHLETDVSRVWLGAGLLQTRNSTSCPREMAPFTTYADQSHVQAKVYPV